MSEPAVLPRIAVLMGGESTEREVSLNSGRAIASALEDRGYDVLTIDLVPSLAGDEPPADGCTVIVAVHDPQTLLEHLRDVDVAFIALHGGIGEDGTLEGLLDLARIPYTCSGVRACAAAIHKGLTKELVAAAGVVVPPSRLLHRQHLLPIRLDLMRQEPFVGLNYPVVVKPACQGSTIGITIVTAPEQMPDALQAACALDEWILIEDFIDGMEATAAVLGADDASRPLPVIEIVPHSDAGFYDYAAKYRINGSEHIVPARLPAARLREIEATAVRVHRLLGCRGVTRSDFRVTADGTAYFLEINTVPGMTATSLVPDAARAAAIEFDELVTMLVADAACAGIPAVASSGP